MKAQPNDPGPGSAHFSVLFRGGGKITEAAIKRSGKLSISTDSSNYSWPDTVWGGQTPSTTLTIRGGGVTLVTAARGHRRLVIDVDLLSDGGKM